jgi:hypothetical protein
MNSSFFMWSAPSLQTVCAPQNNTNVISLYLVLSPVEYHHMTGRKLCRLDIIMYHVRAPQLYSLHILRYLSGHLSKAIIDQSNIHVDMIVIISFSQSTLILFIFLLYSCAQPVNTPVDIID